MSQTFTALLKAHPTYAYLLPELILVCLALLILVLDMFVGEKRKYYLGWVAAAGMALVFLAPMLVQGTYDHALVNSAALKMLRYDGFSQIFNLIFRVSGILVILISMRYKPLSKHVGEFYMFIIMATTAFYMLSASVNFLMIYISIEFGTICCYVLTAYLKEDFKSQEGALKYLLVGSTASAFLLFGISLLLGVAGSLDIYDISEVLRSPAAPNHTLTLVIFVFLLAGFGIKIAMVPFHMWCPEAYEGAPTPITAFLSVAPKAAGVAVLLRVILTVFHGVPIPWTHILEALAILTMCVANLIAIWQTNIKRLMAYSSIAHVGYLLIGLVVAGAVGLQHPLGRQGLFATTIYMCAYTFMNLGVFTVIIAVSNALGSYDIKSYAGLGRRLPFMAVALTVFLLSQAGIPPTIGFIGKFFLFKAAIETGFYLLAVFLVVNSVTSVYYYWNIVRTMFIDEPRETGRLATAAPLWAVTIFLLIAVLGLGLFFQQLMTIVMNSLLKA